MNIIINYNEEEEEEEPEEKSLNNKAEKKETDNCPINFFEIKTKSKRIEQDNENEEEEEESEENDEEEEESEEKSSKDNTDNLIGDFDSKIYGILIPKIVYINPLIRSKLDIEQASSMIKELLEQYDEKYNEIIEQTINAKKNILIEKNEQEIDLNKLAIMYDNFQEDDNDNDFFSKKRNTTANISINNIRTIKNKPNNDIEDKEVIKACKFKLVLPIAKGGYGSVGLYKKSSTLYIKRNK